MAVTGRTRDTEWATPRGDERREAILQALGDTLAEKSFAEVSIAELTERAGVSRSGFYFYFSSKSAAVAELLSDLQARFFTLSELWYLEGPGAPEGRLRVGMHASIAEWRRHPTWFAAMTEAASLDADAGAVWDRWVTAFAERVAETIERDAGERLSTTNAPTPSAIATGLVAMTFKLMELDVRSVIDGGDGLHDLEDTLVHVWLHTIYGEDHDR